jgi:hypothetical protein
MVLDDERVGIDTRRTTQTFPSSALIALLIRYDYQARVGRHGWSPDRNRFLEALEEDISGLLIVKAIIESVY